MLELISPDGVDYTLAPGFPPGKEGVRQLIMMYLEAFPDIHIELEDLIAEEEKVVSRMTST
jgi:predicted ester cyclase